MSDSEKKQKTKGRSPGYPGLDIEAALQKAEELYLKVKRHQTNVVVGVEYWGYKFGTGQSNITLASLKKYGFLEEEGSGKDRKIRITEIAEKIIIDDRPNSEGRIELICQSALKPKIHDYLFAEYEYDLPPDENLIFDLRTELKFTESGARELVSQYRRTLTYIKNLKSGAMPQSFEDEGQGEQGIKQPFTPPIPSNPQDGRTGGGGKVQTIQIPMLEGAWPSITARFPMTEKDWAYMMDVLTTMKPQLVKPDGTEEHPEEENEE